MKKKKGIILIICLLFFLVSISSFHFLSKGTVADDTEIITYEMFGAKGDGVTNDYDAIKAAHDYANKKYIEEGILSTVYSCSDNDCSSKKYYLGSSSGSGAIKVITNVDWKKANFIVDDYVDSDGDGANDVITTDSLFLIVSPLRVFANLKGSYVPYLNYNDDVRSELSSNKLINANTKNLKYLIDSFFDGKIKTNSFYNNNKEEVEKHFSSSQRWAVIVYDSTKNFIRKGVNQNSGDSQSEIILIDSKTGDVLTDINYEYDDITEIRVYPINDNHISIGNGSFTTYTNNVVYVKDSSGKAVRNSYTTRNISSFYTGNIELYNIDHYLNEEKHPYTNTYQNKSSANLYYGFLNISNSVYVSINNSKISAHTPSSLVSNNQITGSFNGTYDLIVDKSVNVFIDNVVYACNIYNSSGDIDYNTCYKKNIIDENKWGIMASNGSKNVFIKNSKLNRIDSHRGGTNLYVADSTIGVGKFLKSLTLTGNGYFYGKNLKIDSADVFVTLRDDYGSTWDGTMVFDNIDFIVNGNSTNPSIVFSNNEENWNFGYTSYFPNLYINNLNIDTTTKNANKVSSVNFLNLSNLYSSGSSTVNKSDINNLYYFKNNIYLNNLTTNGNQVKLFKDSFLNSNTDTLNINNYGGNNSVNLYLDGDVVVDNKVITHSNSKFKLVDSMENKMLEVSTFFENLEKNSKMPSSLEPLIGKINLSSGLVNESISSNRVNYTANVDVDSITIDLETAYIGTYTSWKTKTIDLKSEDNIINFSVMNSSGDVTNYTLNIIRADIKPTLSSTNTLDNIILDNVKLNENFDKDRNEYSAIVNSDSVNITCVKTDDKSVVTGDIGNIKLHYGTNMINIIVTAENGSENKYNISIYREYNLNSSIYKYNKDKNYIYIGNENINNNLLKNIVVPTELDKSVIGNNLVISYDGEELLNIHILNFIISGYDVINKDIKINGVVSYNKFISSFEYSNILSYSIFNSDSKVNTGNITYGMDLKIYYNNEILDNYKLIVENDSNENIDDDDYKLLFDDSLSVLVNNNYINYIKANTTVKQLVDLISVAGGELFVVSNNNVKKENSSILKTGDKLVVYVKNNIKEEYLISILGDSNGDGVVNQLDLTDIRKHIVQWVDSNTNLITEKMGVYYNALDMNRDGVVNQLDLTKMRKILVGFDEYS